MDLETIIQIANLDTLEPGELDVLAHELEKLQTYASFKAQAMRLRARGEITSALAYELKCDYIYSTLHNDLKW